MNLLRALVAVIVAIVVVVACSLPGCEGAAVARVGVGLEDDAELAKKIDEAVLRKQLGQFWGAVLAAKDGKVVIAKGYGVENDGLHAIDADTVMDIGSIAKQFTAAAVLRLEMDGKLSIDDPVSKYFPKAGLRAEKVTLKNLMSHTSGQPAEGTIQRLDFPDRDEAVRLFFVPLGTSKPGEKFEYNNAGYVVLAAVIEKASGKDFAAYVREAVFKPAGLKQTGFLDGVGVDVSRGAARVVSRGGRNPSRLSILQDGWGWGFKGCGGVLTTMNDLVRWDRALAGESVLNAAAKAKLFEVVQDNYALGWMIDSVGDGRTRQYHTGGTRGFRAALSRIPAEKEGESGWVIAVMTNEQGDPVEMEKLVLDEVFPGMKTAARSVMHVGGFKLNKYKVAEFDDGVVVRIGAAGPKGERTLTIAHEEADQSKTMATIVLNKGAAAKFAADLKAAMRARRDEVGEAGKKGVSGMIATMPYTPRDGQIELPDSAEVVVMPRYTGTGENGKQVVDERVTLVVMDRDAGFWPVIVKMDAKAAKELSGQMAGEPRAK